MIHRPLASARLWGLATALLVGLAPAAAADGPPLDGPFGGSFEASVRPEPAPDFAFKDEQGRDSGFVEFRGKVVVALFWATWCPICGSEMPKLDRLQAELGAEGLQVVALSQDEGGPEIVRRWFQKRGIRNLAIYRDTENVLGTVMGIRGIPTSFVIDKQGRVVGRVVGPADWGSEDAASLLRHYLRKPTGGSDPATPVPTGQRSPAPSPRP